jgi:hypothetical protein
MSGWPVVAPGAHLQVVNDAVVSGPSARQALQRLTVAA